MALHPSVDKILVTTDLSEASEAAIEAVRPLADAFGSTITLLHVTEFAPELSGGAADEYRRRVKRVVLAQLDAMRKRVLGERPHARTAVADGRVVWQAICDYAGDHDYDLVAIATHGRSGLSRVLLGSVAERVAGHAPCPVLVVRPHEMRVVLPQA
ncbi:MAG: universal stress protein [Myxococcales bacterium]|nr:universal stress protein [Myxococcales bacterium]